MNKEPMTAKGAQAIRAELEQLRTVARPRVIAAIAEAREHGDLKENAEYHAAREEQGFIEGRIKEIETRLSNAEIIDPTAMNAGGRVVFGATVTALNTAQDKEIRYQIVGVDEADIKRGTISFQSPIARAFIGKEVGDTVLVPAPSGEVEYEILAVDYQ